MGWILGILGGGGGVAFLAGCFTVMRGSIRMADATDRNTAAIEKLTRKVDDLSDRIDGHDTKLAVLEDRLDRRGIR